MADDGTDTPNLHMGSVSRRTEGAETSTRFHCGVYADDVRIAKLHVGGDGTVALLEFPGNFDPTPFLPENLVDLARVVLPKETEGCSAPELLERADISALVTTSPRPGSHIRFNPASGEGADEYRSALEGRVHSYSVEVQIGPVRREISYSSWSADIGSGDVVGYGHTTTRPFHWRTVRLRKLRNIWRSGPGGAQNCKGPTKRDLHRHYRFESFRLNRRCLGSPGKDVIPSDTYFIEHGTQHPWNERTMGFFSRLSIHKIVSRVAGAQLAAQINEATISMLSQKRVTGGSQLR